MKINIRYFLISGLILLLAAMIVHSNSSKQDEPIIFDHYTHVSENELECDYCHSGVANNNANQKAIPDHDVCSDCHDVEDTDNCSICHRDIDNLVGYEDNGYYFAGFAHINHNRDELDCATCHGSSETAGNEPLIPPMTECQSCHQQMNGSLDCESCHLGQKPLPEDHILVSWQQDHGIDAAVGASDCSMCHTQSSCDECHQGINIYGKPHPPTWKFNHFAETISGSECLVCHETRDECIACHKVTLPRPHGLGPDYANNIGGGAHKEDAEGFFETCLACHDILNDDPTCAKCHE